MNFSKQLMKRMFKNMRVIIGRFVGRGIVAGFVATGMRSRVTEGDHQLNVWKEAGSDLTSNHHVRNGGLDKI